MFPLMARAGQGWRMLYLGVLLASIPRPQTRFMDLHSPWFTSHEYFQTNIFELDKVALSSYGSVHLYLGYTGTSRATSISQLHPCQD